MKYVVTCTGIKNVKDEKHVFSVGEELMWQKGIVGKSTAKTLMNTIYFYNGKIFGFRAAAHRIIRPEILYLAMNLFSIQIRADCVI